MKVLILAALVLCSHATFALTDPVDEQDQEFGTALKITREIDVTNDSVPEVLRIETTKATRFEDIKVKLSIYSNGKRIYSDEWKAEDYFEARDTTSIVEKWYRLQRILNDYFANENFATNADSTADLYSDLNVLFRNVRPADIPPDSPEANEFLSAPHRVVHVYAGRDNLYALTYLGSKKNFLKLWRN
jgi:hypothetical protein